MAERVASAQEDPIKEKIRAMLKAQKEKPTFDNWKWDGEYKYIAELAQSKEYDAEIYDMSRELMVRFLAHGAMELGAPDELLNEIDDFLILNEDVQEVNARKEQEARTRRITRTRP